MIEAVGNFFIQRVGGLGALSLLFWESSVSFGTQVVHWRFRWRETVEQTYLLAVQSLPVIAFSIAFVSFMLISEFSFHMKMILQQDSLVPSFSTLLIVRELGPVITCLLLMSRVGAGIAAEIGTMKVTDQLDTLRVLAVEPVELLAVPRWIGCVVAALTLSTIAVGVAILGGGFLARLSMGISPEEFFNTMFMFSDAKDFLTGGVKALVFGSIIPIVALHHGFRCGPGSGGVGDAATGAVVQGSILIIIADFAVTYLFYTL